ncbi:MAG TPA: cytochrome c3 family protein [Thermoanaerobaculia bacterium]|nr:cytochrome c3 family protein [Thermoanaerobaculia bacterium]
MPQLFPPRANNVARGSLAVLVVLVALGGLALDRIQRSPFVTREGVVYEQPVPFSHDHHVAAMGINCRYCHTSVETSSFAGLPSTSTCMNCHKLVWNDSPMLEPVRESYRTGEPLAWNRIHDLPDFVYFDHSIHVAKGIGCESCHGRVDRMPLMFQAASLQMEWCLACHRNPELHVRPREEVYTMGWKPPADQPDLRARLVEEYDIQTLESCSVCHR